MFFKLLSIFVIFNACSAAIIVGNKTIDIKETFEKVCFNELNEYVKNLEKELSNTTTPYVKVNVSTVECLMFCGYKKVGIVDNDGNIETNSLKALLAAENSTVESAILNCAATEKTTNVCEKALKNVKCIFAEVSWVTTGLITFKLMSSYGVF